MKDPRSILITGASSGIGEALAEHYAAPGVTLFLSARHQDRLKAVAARCAQKGAQVHERIVNAADMAGMKEWIEGAEAICPLDLVIANAGISGGTAGRASGEPLAEARAIFDTNLTGVLNTIDPALPAMLVRKKGQIALVSSLAGFRGWPGAPAYSASKGAVRFYGEALRGALARSGVQVNVICPGFVTSRITDRNDFPMPFLMSAPRAATVIAAGLARNKGRIAFPFIMYGAAGLIGCLPDWLAQKILRKMPEKG